VWFGCSLFNGKGADIMNEYLAIGIVLVVFFILLALGQSISSLLATVGLLGIFLLEGPKLIGGFLESSPFTTVAGYTLTTIPLYILMAQFILQSGIVKDFYDIIYKIARGRASVLGALTIVLGGILGAVSGSGSATSATMGQIAYPELVRRGFNKGLAGAVAAAAGSLSAIIPPSIVLIVYGSITQTSIGQLFMAALLPGILMIIVFTLYTVYKYKKTSDAVNYNNEVAVTKEVVVEETSPSVYRYLVAGICGVLILGIIFVGIYSGIFTPTEAGAIGAFIGFLTAAFLGKINLQFLKESLVSTINVTGMVLLIMIGAQLFSQFLSLSLLPRKLIEILGSLIEYPYLIIALLLAIYFIMFMFIEGIAVIVMTVPVVLPLINLMGYDPIWFGILICIMGTVGGLTPPVGMSVYVVSGITKVNMGVIFKQAIMYAVLVTIIVGGLMMVFPEIATWLPTKL
jgi:tripartite ATP-independent transporter DctM subunit